MRKILKLGILLTLAISLLSFQVYAIEIESVEDDEISIQGGMNLGPGSEAPLYSPFESGYVWVSTVEPVKASWSIYDPYFHLMFKVEHVPTIKRLQTDGSWHFGDRSAFTIPAFATKGDWLAKCEYTFADGTKQTLGSAENTDIVYLAYPVTRDDWFASFFTAPFVWFGWVGPSIFIFPLIFLWVPLIWIIICAIYTKSIGGFVKMTKGAFEAGRKAGVRLPRRKKTQRK